MDTGQKQLFIKPFLKWAGGKRWLVSNHSNLIPRDYGRYIEPFLGSGAVFFHLLPNKALLGDTNEPLIITYNALKHNWKLVHRYLRRHQTLHSKDYYYQVRASSPRSMATKAAKFIYLNRTCFNGLYRVNLEGKFNVPIGTRQSVIRADDQFSDISTALESADLYPADFENLINLATANDLIFADPPYTVTHNNNSFIKYNEKLFSWSDQLRLFHALKRAQKRGAKVISTNACHPKIMELYQKDFRIIEVCRNSLISSKNEQRKLSQEIVILTR